VSRLLPSGGCDRNTETNISLPVIDFDSVLRILAGTAHVLESSKNNLKQIQNC
ncbi:hypothetical protein ACJMK2_020296, partial [Sinanodonta woodiana]